MKRKLSLLLAAVMTVSVLPFTATEVQASSANAVRAIPGTTVPANTIFVETDAAGNYGLPGMLQSVYPAPQDSADVPYGMRAGWLEIELNNNVTAGDAAFRLELENAEWFFRTTNIGADMPIMSTPMSFRADVISGSKDGWAGQQPRNARAMPLDSDGNRTDDPLKPVPAGRSLVEGQANLNGHISQVLGASAAQAMASGNVSTQGWPRTTQRIGGGVERHGNHTDIVRTNANPAIDPPLLSNGDPGGPSANFMLDGVSTARYPLGLWSPLMPAPRTGGRWDPNGLGTGVGAWVGASYSTLTWPVGAGHFYRDVDGNQTNMVPGDYNWSGVGARQPIAWRDVSNNNDWIFPMWGAGGIQQGTFNTDLPVNQQRTARLWTRFAQIHQTYDAARGVFIPGVEDSTGSYLRYGWASTPLLRQLIMENARPGTSTPEDPWEEVPYIMQLSVMDSRVATVHVLDNVTTERRRDGQNIIRVPLVIRATASEDIRVSIIPQGNVAFVTASTHLIAAAGGTNTAAHVETPVTGRDRFEIDRLHIRELRTNSLRHGNLAGNQNRRDNAFDLVLPNGFYFENNLDQYRIGLERGLTWRRTNTRQLGVAGDENTPQPPGSTVNGNAGEMAPNRGVDEAGLGFNPNGATDSAIPGRGPEPVGANFRNLGQGDFQVFFPDGHAQTRDRLRFRLNAFNESANIAGALWIDGIVIRAEDSAPFDIDVEIHIENTEALANRPTWADSTGFYSNVHHRNTTNMVTAQTVRAGTRRDWGIILRTEGNIPELISGRYESITSVGHVDHRTATVVFEEVVSNSWWAGRQVVFTLPEEVRWRMIEVLDVEDVAPNTVQEEKYANVAPPSSTNQTLQGGAFAVGGGVGVVRDGVRFDSNQMFWHDVLATRTNPGPAPTRNNRNERALIRFVSWVSIAAHFEGDIILTASGSAVPEEVYETLPSVVIATAIPPVRVETVVTDTRIGYQFTETADIVITETRAGNLLRGREVRLTITDFMVTDPMFSPNTVIEVTDANGLTINRIGTGLTGSTVNHVNPQLGVGRNEGSLNFFINSISTSAPATITVSNVNVRLDRTVPETNDRPYQAVVWGSAIANNFGNHDAIFNLNIYDNVPLWERTNNDRFANYPGIVADYIRVVTGGDGNHWLSQEVRISIGENYYTVNGVQYEMDAAAYISAESESTMVPLRFLSNALGIPDRDIAWDNASRTVTITLPAEVGRVVQFQMDSHEMNDNGVMRSIESAHVPPRLVRPEVVNERVYLPFRFIGESIFQVNVEWDAATQTAIFNPGGNTAN